MATKPASDDPKSPPYDPTSDPQLVALRRSALAKSRLQAMIQNLNAQVLGLVLSGGGGKGAYEVGAILALNDLGLTNFVAIAGTSVGGLNAALCHETLPRGTRRTDRDTILQVWTNMSYSSVLGLSFSAIAKLLLYAFASVGLFGADRSLSMFVSELDAELNSWTDVVVAMIRGMLSVALAVGVAGGVVFYIAFPILQNLPARGLASLLAFFFIFNLAPKLAGWLGRWLALFSNAPLRKMIKSLNLDSICDGTPPVVCTLAERKPKLRVDSPSGGGSRDRYLPYYVALNLLNSKELTTGELATAVLLQTAALPEVFRPRILFDKYCVDGGLADNTPFFGVYAQRPTIVVAVYLNHRFRRIDQLEQYERRRMTRIMDGLNATDDDPMREWGRRVRILPIIPSAPLGEFFLGTLNFRRDKARQLIALGYRDVLNQISALAEKVTA